VKERVNIFSKVNNEDLASINQVESNLKPPNNPLKLKSPSPSPSRSHHKSRMTNENTENNTEIIRHRAKSVKFDEV
jgi:hypothetical protein